ncbi:hypothetical protein BCR37DRAFT_384430 [Protomyces lactucae-debilis]|uniref:Methyltransferase domain-containing protein n=1 Tax=Protomyces lactucae-debilis TaxID=2754530 RepID=A0A1Y2ETH8_PROLT|nr:uncharacterized protein BCR37DRAFT_384430 [Protomyces lactucae-debilis]ORY74614.1 hypothetical protein BCR37DRAFT_384430 [Protomyces lactucae-debilis]
MSQIFLGSLSRSKLDLDRAHLQLLSPDDLSTQIHFRDNERHFLTRYLGPHSDSDLNARCQQLLNHAQHLEAYTTILGLNWLLPQVSLLPTYQTLARRFTDPYPPVVCELGAGIGTDIRQCLLDGLPRTHLIASDVVAGYWQLGLDFFNDRTTLPVKTCFCNAAAPVKQPNPLDQFNGRVDAFYSLMVLHVFDQQAATAFLARQFNLLAPGGLCFGTTCGAQIARAWPVRGHERWLFDKSALRALLESCGFGEVVVEETVLSARMREMMDAKRSQVDKDPMEKDMLVLSFSGVKILPEWASC